MDMYAKGRAGYRGRKGVKHHKAKLTDAKVRTIRRLAANGVPRIDLARRYGVSKPTIGQVITRRVWSHVE